MNELNKILKKCKECNKISLSGNRDLCPKNCIGYKYQQTKKETSLHCWSIHFAFTMRGYKSSGLNQ